MTISTLLVFFQAYHLCSAFYLQVAALILENTFTSILDMAGVLLPFLKWFIGGSSSKGPRILNCLVRSPWSTIDIIGEVRLHVCNLIQDCILMLDSGTGSANRIRFSNMLVTMLKVILFSFSSFLRGNLVKHTT